MTTAQPEPTTKRVAQRSGGSTRIRRPRISRHYLPIRHAELVEVLCQQDGMSAEDQAAFRALAQLLSATLHYEFHARLEELKDVYAPFDPDRATAKLISLSEEDRQQRLEQLFARFAWLFERANYERLSRDAIEQVLHVVSDFGVRLDVDLDVLERLEVFARGETKRTGLVRHLRSLFRPEMREVRAFERLVVLFRVRPHKQLLEYSDSSKVYIKLFKNIPHTDLEMLLPGTRVRMTWLDRGKILVPTLSGVGIVLFKMAKLAVVAGVLGLLGSWLLVAALFGYGFRSFQGYQKALQRYQLKLQQNLYFQNLDNNFGVLFRLLDDAEEQEMCEALLAYYFLWRLPPGEDRSADELDGEIESFLEAIIGQQCDFEIDDALAKLTRWGIARQCGAGRYRAVPVADAKATLDRAWDDAFHYNTRA